MISESFKLKDPIPVEVESSLTDLIAHVAHTGSEFVPLLHSDRYTQPIPFFGEITSAHVVTIGVNPSAEEFAPSRDWPSARMPARDLAARLTRYFESGTAHPWFDGWTRALDAGGATAASHAHLDLSPRATRPFSSFTMGRTANADLTRLFMRMVEGDLPYFARFLDLCSSARVAFLAGGVTNIYMDDFLAQRLRDRIRFPSGKRKSGSAPVTRPSLKVGHRWIPALFVGVGPSRNHNWPKLAQRLTENRQYIIEALSVAPEQA
jgi:hypothetical protein